MSTQIYRSCIKLLTYAAIAFAGISGCGSSPVGGSGEAFTPDTHAITLGGILELDGQYGPGCVERTGGWSVPMVKLSQLSNPPLSVIMNNSDCVLTLTSVRAGDAEESAALYSADLPIQLTASFLATPSAFRVAPGRPVAFYANARIEPDASFHGDFNVRMAYSEQPMGISANKQSAFAMQQGTASTSGVAAPDYQVDLSEVQILVDVNLIVQSVSGTVDLFAGLQSGQQYVVTDKTFSDPPTYGDVDEAFLNGVQIGISDLNPKIPIDAFGLVGMDQHTPIRRTIIIAESASAGRSYQLITLSFLHP